MLERLFKCAKFVDYDMINSLCLLIVLISFSQINSIACSSKDSLNFSCNIYFCIHRTYRLCF